MKIYKNKNTISAKLDDDLIILNLKSGHYLQLNKTATDIWDLISTINDYSDLEKKLYLMYDIDERLLRKDLNEFIKLANDKNLISISN